MAGAGQGGAGPCGARRAACGGMAAPVVSTSGLGVAWLHLRIDTRPKYYNVRPSRCIARSIAESPAAAGVQAPGLDQPPGSQLSAVSGLVWQPMFTMEGRSFNRTNNIMRSSPLSCILLALGRIVSLRRILARD